MQEVTRVLVASSERHWQIELMHLSSRPADWRIFYDMLFHGKIRVKPKSKIPYFLCKLNVLWGRPIFRPKFVEGISPVERVCYFDIQQTSLSLDTFLHLLVSTMSWLLPFDSHCECTPISVLVSCDAPSQVHLHVVGMLLFMSTPFCSILVSISIFTALSTVFHSITSPYNYLFSHCPLPVLSPPYWSFQLYVSLWKSPSVLTLFLAVAWAQNTK